MKTSTAFALKSAMLTALALAGCASAPPQVSQWNPPPLGASWEVAQRNTGSYGRDQQFRITRTEGTWQGKPVVAMKNSLGPTLMADPATGRWHALVAADGKPMFTFEPAIGWTYPVKIGASSTTRHRVTNHVANRTLEYDFSCKVEAYEKVTVRAGTFDSYRLDCRTTVGNEETYWMSPDLGVMVKTRLVRTAASPQGAGTQEAELVAVPRR